MYRLKNEVVKEEKRSNYDNRPYGQLLPQITQSLFTKHPYRWLPIGSMEHLDAATLDEFIAYNKKFYVPNNAVLVVAGNFEIDDVKKKLVIILVQFQEVKKYLGLTLLKIQ